MKILAFIPARGGSKSIPRKNIKHFNGFPLISYSISAALRSAYDMEVVVSTDDPEIADISKKYGARIPFIRPDDLSGDEITDFPVLDHCMNELAKSGEQFDLIVHLRPTSPVRPHDLIDKAIQLLISNPEADSVRSVSIPDYSPYKMYSRKEGYLEPVLKSDIPEAYNQGRQKLPEVFWHNGLVDVVSSKCVKEKRSISGNKILALETDRRYAVDLDNEWEWTRAEYLVQQLDLNCIKPDLL